MPPAVSGVGGGSPDEVVATVGSTAIANATLEHWMTLGIPAAEVPSPPGYTACIEHLDARSKAATGAATSTERRTSCEGTYQGLLRLALGAVIRADWLTGEAAEDGLKIGGKQVDGEIARYSRGVFSTEADVQGSQATYDAKLERLTDTIFASIKRRSQHRVTHAQVLAFYDEHQRQYMTPEGRAVRILRTLSEGSALRRCFEIEGFGVVS